MAFGPPQFRHPPGTLCARPPRHGLAGPDSEADFRGAASMSAAPAMLRSEGKMASESRLKVAALS